MKQLAISVLLAVFIFSTHVFGQTCPTSGYTYSTAGNSNSNWSAGGTWNGGVAAYWPPVASYTAPDGSSCTWCVVIPANKIVDIENTGGLTLDDYSGHSISLMVVGTLVVNGKLYMLNDLNSTTITVATGGLLCCNNTCNASDKVNLGGSNVWGGGSGSTAPVSGPASSSGGTVLPILLTSFRARPQASSIEIKWSTASELNFDYFSLQRSTDGIVFKEIAQIKGNGTTNEMHAYSYDDTDPIIGTSYYRLTSIDFDGYQENFKVVSVDYQGEKKFRVSPNPSDGSTLTLNFNFANEGGGGQVIIYDNLGSIVGTYQVAGTNSVSIDNVLKSGVYLAKYSSSTFTKTERFIVR